MYSHVNQRYRIAALVVGLALASVPLPGGAAPTSWIDQVVEVVEYHKVLTQGQGRDAAYDPYLGQLGTIRAGLNRGDEPDARAALNRFMGMLEAREGGISAQEAAAIWHFTYRVAPLEYHNAVRHMQAFGSEYLQLLQRVGESWIGELAERVSMLNGIERYGRFDLYLKQLNTIRQAFRGRDQQATAAEMNRFMDMLENQEGGITPRAANILWEDCYKVTPAAFHDVTRHHARPDLLSEAGPRP